MVRMHRLSTRGWLIPFTIYTPLLLPATSPSWSYRLCAGVVPPVPPKSRNGSALQDATRSTRPPGGLAEAQSHTNPNKAVHPPDALVTISLPPFSAPGFSLTAGSLGHRRDTGARARTQMPRWDRFAPARAAAPPLRPRRQLFAFQRSCLGRPGVLELS